MTVLYAIARERHRLVAGTGNKSELLLGYFTKYGDGGVDIVPLGDLYKTDLRTVAKELGLPAADPGTSSDGGPVGRADRRRRARDSSYEDVDQILYGLEQLRSEEESLP